MPRAKLKGSANCFYLYDKSTCKTSYEKNLLGIAKEEIFDYSSLVNIINNFVSLVTSDVKVHSFQTCNSIYQLILFT